MLVSSIELVHGIIGVFSGVSYPVHYVTPLIKLISFALVAAIMYASRKQAASSSVVLFFFWLLYGLISVFSSYSLAKNILCPVSHYVWACFRSLQYLSLAYQNDQLLKVDPFDRVLKFIGYALIVIQMVLSCSSDGNLMKLVYEKDGVTKPIPELSASVPSLLSFWWVNPLIILGYKRPLKIDDLYELRHENQTLTCYNHFTKYWNPRDTSEKRFLVWPLFRAFLLQILATSSLKLISCCLTFANPIILNNLLVWLDSDKPLWQGVLFAFLMFTVSFIDSMLSNTYEYHIWLNGLKMRSAVTDAIYQKAFRLSPACRSKYTTGQIVNLMAVDAQKIFDFMMSFNQMWISPLQITIAFFLLWQQLGIATLAGIAVMLTLIPLNAYVTKFTRRCQIQVMKEKDKRAKMLNEVFAGIKVLKLYGWEPSFISKMKGIRAVEMKCLREQIRYISVQFFTMDSSPIFVAVVTFLTFTLISPENNLNASKAFVSLALLNLIRMPIGSVPMLVNKTMMFMVSMARITDYLNGHESDLSAITRDARTDGIAIEITNASFSWDPDSEVQNLDNISLNVKKGELVAIVGRVGTGKSSLMSALLSDMYKREGSVSIDGTLAYVPQQAWIQNATVKQNIIFTSHRDEQKYNKVLDACALLTDLKILPAGDETEIGEKGINLSGGQKQRVSLARAVYSDNDIILMDDPLSAVDTHVGKHIFEQVIGPKGMLKNKTRILVTQKITLLPLVDNIIVMVDGKISEAGSYQQLMQKGGAFADFIMEFLSVEEGVDDDEDLKLIRPEIERQLSLSLVSRSSSPSITNESGIGSQTLNRRLTNTSVKSIQSIERKEERKSTRKHDEGKLVKLEEEKTGGVKWDVYKEYFKALGLWSCCFIVICSVTFSGFNIGASVWLSKWAADGTDNRTANDSDLRDLRIGVYGALGTCEALFTLASNTLIFFAILRASALIHNMMLDRIMRSPMSFFDTTPTGRLLNRFTKDIDVLDTNMRMNLRQILNSVLKTTVTVIILLMQTPYFLVAFLPLMLVYTFVQRLYIASSRQLKRIDSTSKSPVYTHFSETVTGSTSIRAFDAVQHFTRNLERRVDRNGTAVVMSAATSRWLAVRLELMGNIIVLFSSLAAVMKLGGTSAAEAGLTISYALAVTGTLNMLIRASVDLENSLVSVERCIEYMSVPSESEWYIDATRPADSWPEKGKVTFERYSTRYREGLDLVLREASFQSQEHEKIGIVGRTGAGKSSLTLALFRLIESVRGRIVIDSVDIAGLGLLDLRSRLTIIPQDPVLFSGSLRMNLDPFDAHPDERVWQALRLAHLQDFAAGLDGGLDHEVTEGGDNLSVGQRQLVCLARALLRKSRILVLDEATAAVDVETDELIQRTIRSEFADCTIITIAHRLNTVVDYDRILVLDDGRVAEFDSPQNLMRDSNSLFHSMAKVAGLLNVTISNESD